MNLADLTSLIILGVGLISPLVICAEYDTPWWVFIALGVSGLIVGFLVAQLVRNMAYMSLKSEKNKISELFLSMLYLSQPFLAISVSVAFFFLWSFTLEQLGYTKANEAQNQTELDNPINAAGNSENHLNH